MNVLVTGSSGQLGRKFRDILLGDGADFRTGIDGVEVATIDNNHYYLTTHSNLNIADVVAVKELVDNAGIDLILNFAAFTDVPGAETSEYSKSWETNVKGPDTLAFVAKYANALLVHISTDYVYAPYNGWDGSPFKAEDAGKARPLNVYGQHKYEGEQKIVRSGCRYLIIRTSWLYSTNGKNFVNTIIKKLQNGDKEIKVVDDQIGTPTRAYTLALHIYEDICQKGLELLKANFHDIYNFTAEGCCSWYEYAQEIAILGGYGPFRIKRCTSDEFPTPVKRPHYSVMSLHEYFTLFPDTTLLNWRTDLEIVINAINIREINKENV